MTDICLHPSDSPWAWRGVAEWVKSDGHCHPWRVSRALTGTAHNEHFTHRVRTPAGVRAEIRTDAAALTVAGRLYPSEERGGEIDVVVDGELLVRVAVPIPAGRGAGDRGQPATAGVAVEQVVQLPPGRKAVEVWLPHTEPFGLRRLDLHGATVAAAPPRRPHWLTYGSSITQCAAARGPSEAWPALVGRELGLDLYALGLGGQCHLDHAVGQAVAEQPLDALSLCLGINIYGRGSFDERSLGSALHGFLARALHDHPDIPVVLMSPTFAPHLEDEPNRAGLTLAEVRETVRRVAEAVAERRVTYVDGREILGPEDAGYLREDRLHPTAEGYRLMAERLTPRLAVAFHLTATATLGSTT